MNLKVDCPALKLRDMLSICKREARERVFTNNLVSELELG